MGEPRWKASARVRYGARGAKRRSERELAEGEGMR
ncbi:uncharacterized protein SOCE836_004200 [Sorangium cellulosum]|uniref:Uncharacterized protein n=1 Tax=Sorangium cellulosum TaxID=56 RepID=A0A4P2QET4_SORCE|nr:uncharacterized protein SOCE836_004200 [Sorangium cellulosum]WCQ87742.1 hypothetical protein NQZ70_00405 [Sorangium sp. Soce836]